VAVTSAGDLQSRKIIHAIPAPPVAGGEASLRDAVINALSAAERERLESISIPAVGTGAGYPADVAAAAVYAVCASYRGGVRLIRLVGSDDDAVAAFKLAREAYNRAGKGGGGAFMGGSGGGGGGGSSGGGGASGPPSYSPTPGPSDVPLVYPHV
jgi:hypothetical protein